jgi:hypothetical protein
MDLLATTDSYASAVNKILLPGGGIPMPRAVAKIFKPGESAVHRIWFAFALVIS